MRSISIQFKDSAMLPLLAVAFFLLIPALTVCAAEPDTSKEDNSKAHGIVQGTGETAVGFIKGTDQALQGFGEGFDQSAKGLGTGAKESLYGFIDGTGKVVAGATGQKASKSSETKSEETTVK